MLVYRAGARPVSSEGLRLELLRQLGDGSAELSRQAALLCAGELEAGLADALHPSAPLVQRFTDRLADAWLGHTPIPAGDLRGWRELPLPERLCVGSPEGFAYYALDPARYAALARAQTFAGERVAVVGIRSIGTTLSALVCSVLRSRGLEAERITLRPRGHPFDRTLDLHADAERFVQAYRGADFLVVDEGPGASGSTFLAVGEALERAGVGLSRIRFLPSHAPDPERLLARDGARRWRRFRSVPLPPPELPEGAEDASGGLWRGFVYGSERKWPACWAALERHKYRLPGSADLTKFVGFSPYGDAAVARGGLLSEAGFCPRTERARPGYVRQSWCEGRPLSARAARRRVLPRLLDYLVVRSHTCAAGGGAPEELEHMARTNLEEQLGAALPDSFHLELEAPVFPDGRLLPHEWVDTPEGDLIKVDALDHGDDHLLPGPCDTAWDVAGAIVEWELSDAEASYFLERYAARTGDQVARRVSGYVLAYAALRVGYCHTAALSAAPDERARLLAARGRYTALLSRLAEPTAR